MSILNCINTDSCSTQITKSDLVTYLGLDLLCTNIQTSEDLTAAIINIDARFCSIIDTLNVCCTTTTTSTSTSTTTTTTECPCTTTTTTSPPTTTTTTTAANYLEPCTVLVNYGENVYAYDPNINTTTFLGKYAPGGNDIANTATKMWLYSSTLIYEYNITLSPWTAVFNRTISLPAGVQLGQGLFAVNNTLLYASNTYPGGSSPNKIVLLNIVGAVAGVTNVISLAPVGTVVSGDILYTTTSKLLVTTTLGAVDQLRQYDAISGNLELAVTLSSFGLPYGLFQNAGNLYIFTGSGFVRQVDVYYPYAVDTVDNTGQFISGASQQPSCITVSLQTTTTTSSTTTTSTSTTSTTTTIYIPTVNLCGIQIATKNLNVSKYKNGDVIPQITDPAAWADATTGAWCYYNNDVTNQIKYGKLYNWYAVNDPRGLAPNGYHVVTDAEMQYIGACINAENTGGKMKEVGTSHWAAPNTGATNSSGFTGLPGGYRSAQTTFLPHTAPFASITTLGIFWTATTFDVVSARAWALSYNNNFLSTNTSFFGVGMSVRVVKD